MSYWRLAPVSASVLRHWPESLTLTRMFTADNTEGFTDAELELLNRALRLLMQDGIDESNASDIVTDNYRGDGTDTAQTLAMVRTPHTWHPR